MKPKLIYLSEKQVIDNSFLRDLATHLAKIPHQFLIIHQPISPNITETRFLTKRISAHFNEVGYHNLAFSGDQKGIWQIMEGQFSIQKNLLSDYLKIINCLILNSICKNPTESYLEDPLLLLNQLKLNFELETCLFFPENLRSPLGDQPKSILTDEDTQNLLELFPEESNIIQKASNFKQSIILQPKSLNLYCAVH